MDTTTEQATSRRHARAGFTLIELLIVVVIIGVLASIAIPKFAATKEKAYVAKLKGDLRNLMTAQEGYLADNGGYYIGAVPSVALAYNPSGGSVITITAAVPGGWAATAAMPAMTARTCAVFVGAAPPPAPAVSDGMIACN